MDALHPLASGITPPPHFTYPFCYTPHPLALAAADEVQRAIASNEEWRREADKGKMFGVLVVRTNGEQLGFLAAYSGLFCGRNDWDWFVPPVFDLLRPDGYFKEEEAHITDIGSEISALESCEERTTLLAKKQALATEAEATLAAYKRRMDEAKLRRDTLRLSPLDEATEAALTKESQHMKAEYRRMRKAYAEREAMLEESLSRIETRISTLKKQRRTRSEALQAWLFGQFRVLNAQGEERDLANIFAATPSHIPPSGAGECCAPQAAAIRLQEPFTTTLHGRVLVGRIA